MGCGIFVGMQALLNIGRHIAWTTAADGEGTGAIGSDSDLQALLGSTFIYLMHKRAGREKSVYSKRHLHRY